MSDDNVVTLNVPTTIDLPPERIIAGAAKADLETVVVMGYTRDGDVYFASSAADGGDVLWLMEQCKLHLMGIAE